ncbi:hypothetical protein CYLTODRAFT_424354 [Cylindrobasidium torrendii FP15055 ss-10]|uniref:Mid2 domain-containing protein n=1 Tax=Cylindrobasidium torrendii FP15055 ss-10 TaxID=1314674 RepID=A0A0D7B4M7_9AGAR|nr:hypothetical protein CYLTODRAFT_424354 [Cylindrobasidium torrendii FP15055 ss-10]
MLGLNEYRARSGAALPRQGPSGSTGLGVDASGSVETGGTGAGTGTGTDAGPGTQTDNNQPTNTGGGSSSTQQQTSTQQETSTQSSTPTQQPTSTQATSTAPTSTQPTSSASPTSTTSRTSVTTDSTSVPPTSSIPPSTSTEVATRTQSRTSSSRVSSPTTSASNTIASDASASRYTTFVTTLSDGRSTTVTSPLPTNLSTSSPSSDSYSRTALIAGVTAGGVVLLALALGAIFIVKRSKKRRIGWIEAMRQHKREGKGAGAVGLLDGEFDDEDDPFVARGGRYRDNHASGSGSGGRGTPETEMRTVPSHHYHYQTRQQPGGGIGSQVPQLPVPPGYHTPVSASELSLQSPALGVHGSPFGAGNISNHSRTSIFRTSDSGSIFHEALDDNPNTEDPFKVVYPSPPPGITPPPSSFKSPPPVVTISPSSSAPKVTFSDAPTHAPRPASPSRVAFIDENRAASSPSPSKHLGSSPLRVVE